MQHMLCSVGSFIAMPQTVRSHSVVSSVEVRRADVPKRSVVKIRPAMIVLYSYSHMDGNYVLSITSWPCLPPVCAGLGWT